MDLPLVSWLVARVRLALLWPRWRQAGAAALVAAGTVSLFLTLHGLELALPVPPALRALMAGLLTVGFLAPAVRGRSGADSSVNWLVFLPLLALPTALPAAVPLGLSCLALAWQQERRGQASARQAELLSAVALVAAVCVLYLLIGHRARGHNDNDAHYYFGVARHMVRTGRYEEPIVWQFLAPAASLVHRPFDYWHGLTSLLLVPPLALFGASHRTALVTMAVVSCVGLGAFWMLLGRALPRSSSTTRWIAFFGFAFAPGSAVYRFDTETVPVFQTLLALALLAFAWRAYLACTALAFLLVLTRGEGIWSFAILGAACLWRSYVEGGAGLRSLPRRLAPLWLGLALGLLYVGYHLWMFHAVAPPGARVAPFATPGSILYFNTHLTVPPVSDWLGTRLEAGYIRERAGIALVALREAGFTTWPDLWLLLICLSGVGAWGLGSPVLAVTWTVLLLGTFLSSWSNPTYFAIWRAPHVMLPALWLLNAAVLERATSWATVWACAPRSSPARWLLRGAVTIALLGFALQTTSLYGDRPFSQAYFSNGAKLRRLSSTLGGQPVAAVRSWQAMADTTSPVLQIPHDGEAAMVAAFKKYRVVWLLLNAPTTDLGGRSGPVLKDVLEGKRSTLGDLRLERVDNPTDLPLFRITPSPASRK